MMFKAFVTICMIAMPNTCQTLEDTRGPYETQTKCKERALEIMEMVIDIEESEISPEAALLTPLTVISRVDLPAPLEPIRATISPLLTFIFTPLKA